MKWNKRAKLTATATSALLLTLLLASCANNNNNEIPLPVNNQVQQEQTDENDNSSQTDNDEQNEQTELDKDTAAENNADKDEDETIYEVTGTYIGAIDNNSVEVTVDGQATVFQLTEDFKYVISDFKEQSNVQIKYTEHITEDGNYVKKVITDITVK